MSIPRTPDRLELWERWEAPVLAALPYVLLVIVAGMTVVIKSGESTGNLLIDLGLAAAAGVWMLWMFTLHPAWRQRPRVMSLFFVVLAVLMALLVLRAPWYGFFTFTGYLYAFYLPAGRFRALGVVTIALITATSQNGGLPKQWTTSSVAIYLVIICINVSVAGALTWFGWVSSQQNDQRKHMVEELSEANRRLESTLVENAGLHDQLLAQAREAGVLDERQRMAREIHDTLAQGLTGIITQLQAAEREGQSVAERRRHIDLATQLARDSLTEARRSVRAMQPEPLESARLPEALTAVADKFTKIHGVPATVTTTGEPRRIRPEAEITLLRAAQEAMVNVARHARAGKVGLTLSYMEDQVNLDIRDDGVGFDPQPADAMVPARAGGSGYGLLAMRQRIEGVAGTLEVESAPGGGTAISASVPTDASGPMGASEPAGGGGR